MKKTKKVKPVKKYFVANYDKSIVVPTMTELEIIKHAVRKQYAK